MKKILLFICVLAYTFNVYANPVSQKAALKKASQFMRGKVFLLANVAESGKKGPNGASPYFVFNAEDDSGFVIVSGDDRTKPILGYSETGSMKENALPDNVQWLLDYYSKVVSSLEGIPFDTESNSTAANVRSTISPLIKTNWNQRSPWNDLCVFDGVQCLTGCVATAMAQIVNYCKYPDKVSAMDAYTAYWSQNSFPSLPATTLNWTNMTNEDMAKLCRYCGQSVEMDYGQNSSSAASESVSLALVKYFNYNKSTHVIYRDGYSPEGWEDEIYQELAEGYPILYSGQSVTNSGHAFIVDGYENGLFHVNWGWGGYCDGHFVLTVMDSRGPEYPGSAYSEEQSAIVGIRPNQGGTLNYPLMTISMLELASESEIITRSSSSENFGLDVSYIVNNSVNEEGIACGYGFALYKGDEMVQKLLQYSPSQQRPGWYYSGTKNLSFGAGLDDGTYRIECVYRDNDDNLHQAQGFGYRYVEAVLQGNSLTLTNYPLTKLKLSKTKLTIAKGQIEELTATCPSSWSNKKVTWESSDPTIVKVSSTGMIKGMKVGTATITCTSKATNQTATCEVTVGYVKLSKNEVCIEKGKTLTLKSKVYPTTADQSVTWESSDPTTVKVTASGKIGGLKVGTATITCTSVATGLSATCEVTVGYVKLSKNEVTIEKGKTLTLKSKVYPTTADQSVTWESSDEDIVIVKAGKIKGMKTGTATITCTSVATGLSATCEVTVGYVKLSKNEVTIEKGKTLTLKSKIYPTTVDQSVSWESSDPTIVKVASTGKIKGLKVGTATITCTSVATGLSATCEVTVTAVANTRSLGGGDDELTGIDDMDMEPAVVDPFDVYDLSGRKVRHQVTSLDGLPNGVYIVNGEKVLKK